MGERQAKENMGRTTPFSLRKAGCVYPPNFYLGGSTMFYRLFALSAIALAAVQPAQAQEVYAGSSFHGVDTPFTLEAGERGSDVQAGIRSAPIEALDFIGKPSAYLHGQVSLNGNTNVAAVGLSWKIGHKIYVRPGFGLALHDDRIKEVRADRRRIDLGSRILFEPEIAVGAKISEKLAAELSWVHISNATLLSKQNPGMDFIGARLVYSIK
jgi:lipid A 3-O-deacylase